MMRLINRGVGLAVIVLFSSACSNDGGASSGSGGGSAISPAFTVTFMSAKCQDCHAFDTGNAIAQKHVDLGRSEEGELSRGCAECHSVPGWRAPFRSFSFSGLSAQEMCIASKNKFGGDVQALQNHLLNSELIQWAILRGAPPGDLGTWSAWINDWVGNGASCG